jgi:hypothetical protein
MSFIPERTGATMKNCGRRAFLRAAAAVPILSRTSSVFAAPSVSRIALVVGNDRYKQAPLKNAVNDAKGMAALLTQAGFAVDLRLDTPRAVFVEAIERFGAAAAGADVSMALFYYAGHGLQVDWRNYLLPVDATVAETGDVRRACVDFDLLLGKLVDVKGKTLVVILDACRDNPVGASYAPVQKGLSPFDAPAGSLIAYSTAPGKVAADGSGDHGLYTESLIRELSVKEQRIEDVFKRVRLDVRLASRGAQVPWESTSLESDVFLFPAARKLSGAELEKQFEEELADWNRIKASTRVEDWAGYLRRYPHGKFSELAHARLNRLLAALEPVPVVAAPKATPVEIKAGAPEPRLWVPSPNPYSAGTAALGRTYTVGDETTFRESDLLSGAETRVFTLRVTGVDPVADRVEFNGGEWVSDTMGNVQKMGRNVFEFPVQTFAPELQVGKKWSTRFKLVGGGAGVDVADADLRVARVERIAIPAGTMETFRIEMDGFWRSGRQLKGVYWVVPGVNALYVKREFTLRAPNGQYLRTERHELVSHRQAA